MEICESQSLVQVNATWSKTGRQAKSRMADHWGQGELRHGTKASLRRSSSTCLQFFDLLILVFGTTALAHLDNDIRTRYVCEGSKVPRICCSGSGQPQGWLCGVIGWVVSRCIWHVHDCRVLVGCKRTYGAGPIMRDRGFFSLGTTAGGSFTNQVQFYCVRLRLRRFGTCFGTSNPGKPGMAPVRTVLGDRPRLSHIALRSAAFG